MQVNVFGLNVGGCFGCHAIGRLCVHARQAIWFVSVKYMKCKWTRLVAFSLSLFLPLGELERSLPHSLLRGARVPAWFQYESL
jgi:hypothetical protein